MPSAASMKMELPNFLLITYDSCRYDAMKIAATPVLDSYAEVLPAQSPANFTYAAHQAFFVGMLPNCEQPIPYYNRFSKQLLALTAVGETLVAKNAAYQIPSDVNIIDGLAKLGFQTVGSGAMNWFKQRSLTCWFDRFAFIPTDARKQIDFLLSEIDTAHPFFGFINFGETHNPFTFEGNLEPPTEWIESRRIEWPPHEEGSVGIDNSAYIHQVRAIEYLDTRLPSLFSKLPGNTVVILCGDHGECFGEKGYWGHGVNHQKVQEVPLAIFRLDGEPLP